MTHFSWDHCVVVPPSGGALSFSPELGTMLLATRTDIESCSLVQTWRWDADAWRPEGALTLRGAVPLLAHGMGRTLLFVSAAKMLLVFDASTLQELERRECDHFAMRFASFDEAQKKFVIGLSRGRNKPYLTLTYDTEGGWTSFDSPTVSGAFWDADTRRLIATGSTPHVLEGETWVPLEGSLPPLAGRFQSQLGRPTLAADPDGRWFSRENQVTFVREPGEDFVPIQDPLFIDIDSITPGILDGRAAVLFNRTGEVRTLAEGWTERLGAGHLPGSSQALALDGQSLFALSQDGALWRTEPDSEWSKVADGGPPDAKRYGNMGGPRGEFGWPMQVHEGRVFVCTKKETWVWDGAWSKLAGKGPSGRFGSMVSTPSGLYASSDTALWRLTDEAWVRVVYDSAFKAFFLAWEPTRNLLLAVGSANVEGVESDWICAVVEGAWRPLARIPGGLFLLRDSDRFLIDPEGDRLLILSRSGVRSLPLALSLPREEMPRTHARRKTSMGALLDNTPALTEDESATRVAARDALASDDMEAVKRGCQQLIELERPLLISELLRGTSCSEQGKLDVGEALAKAVKAPHRSWVALRLLSHQGKLDGLRKLDTELGDLDALRDLALTHIDLHRTETVTDLTPLVERRISPVERLERFGRRFWDFEAGPARIRLDDCAQLADLAPLGELTQLYQLELTGCEALKDVSTLPKALQRLSLEGAALTGTDDIARLTSLTRLSLRGSAVTDLSGLAALRLSSLDLRGCHALTTLDGLPRLQTLMLGDNPALQDLAGLTKLSLAARLRCRRALADGPLAEALWTSVRDDVAEACSKLAASPSATNFRQLWDVLEHVPAGDVLLDEVEEKLAEWPDASRKVEAVGPEEVQAIIERPAWRLVRSAIFDGDLERLHTQGLWDACTELSSLVIAGNGLDDDGLVELSASEHLTKLTSLGILGVGFKGFYDFAGGKTPITQVGWRALSQAKLPNLTSLDLAWQSIESAEVDALLSGPLVGQLTTLDLRFNALDSAGVATLAQSARVSGLLELGLHRNGVKAEGLAALVASPHLQALRRLDLSDNGGLDGVQEAGPLLERLTSLELAKSLSDDGGRALLRLDLSRLTSLGLAHTPLSDSAEVLAGAKLDSLTSLDLSGTGLGDAGLTALMDKPVAKRLRELTLAGCFIHDDGPLARATELVTLDIGGNNAADVSALASLTKLRSLDLSNHKTASLEALLEEPLRSFSILGTSLELPSVHAIIRRRAERFSAICELPNPSLEHLVLELSRVHLDDSVVEAIAQNPLFSCVAYLHLEAIWHGRGETITARGVATLANSPHLGAMISLDLSGHHLESDALAALCEGTGLSSLRSLRWASNTARDLSTLAKSPLLSQLTSLDLTASEIDDKGVIELAKSPNSASLRRLLLGGNALTDKAVRAIVESPYLSGLELLAAQNEDMGKATLKRLESFTASSTEIERPPGNRRLWR
ncbi:MAG: hypothetical protein GXP55_17780 [Deltaproteobacteria bacterium]|nr:hypothetical protein [Deltaproteobacteria bacterium]